MTEGCDYLDCRVPPERHDECAAAPISMCWGWPLQHQHVKKRSAGGKACEVMLCPAHHQQLDAGHRYEGLRASNHIVERENGRRTYQIRSREGDKEVLVEIELSDMVDAQC